jgi:hypothetical protein
MKIIVVTDQGGKVVGTAHDIRSGNPASGDGGPVAAPGQSVRVIDMPSELVPPVIDSAVDFRIDGSAMTEMHRDRETDCREEVCGDAQR